MKQWICAVLSAFLLMTPAFAQEEILPASSVPDERFFQMTVKKGEIATLSARELEIRLGLKEGELLGITITALPRSGSLVLDGARLGTFAQLDRQELDRLCLVPGEGASAAGFSFIPDCPDRAGATLSVLVADQLPDALTARDLALHTWSDLWVQSKNLSSFDGEDAILHITRAPILGTAKVVGQSLCYQPFSGIWGEDRFSYVLEDAYGNLSREATVSVTIRQNEDGFSFADMTGRAEAPAAVTLHKNGILCGEQMGGSWYFQPDAVMSREQFLIALLAARDLPLPDDAVIRTGLANDSQIPLWLKPYLQAAVDHGLWTADTFIPGEPMPTAQAKSLLAHSFHLPFSKAVQPSISTAIPGWEQPANDAPLTRAACAVLLAEATNNFPS